MKKTSVLLFVIITLVQTSCQKYSYIENELHGLWQITAVEDKTTAETTEAQGDLYYSFQRNMVIVSYKYPTKPTGLMMTQYNSDFFLEGDSIHINDFRLYQEYDKKAPLQELKKFGIHGERTAFHINRTNRKSMILESDLSRVSLRKY